MLFYTISKKDYLIKIFEKLEPYRSIVGGFLALLQSPLCTNEDIEKMFDLFQEHILTIQNQELKNKAQKVFDYLKHIQKQEQLSKGQDEKDIEDLLLSLEKTQ